MNEHEIDRIAAGMNQLRPDWPVRQLTTLLKDTRMVDRPRRDVAVALAWVACEPRTSTPYRVLEAGPWWKAAGIEGSAHVREVLNPAERCGICSERHDRCRSIWVDDHEFEPGFVSHEGHVNHQIIEAIKAEVVPAPVVVEKKLADLLPAERNEYAVAARAAMTTTTTEERA